MKTIVLLAAVIIGITIPSCKKDYVCRCTKTYTDGTGTDIQDYALYPYSDTKNKAKERCKTNNIASGDFGGSYIIDCEIQ